MVISHVFEQAFGKSVYRSLQTLEKQGLVRVSRGTENALIREGFFRGDALKSFASKLEPVLKDAVELNKKSDTHRVKFVFDHSADVPSVRATFRDVEWQGKTAATKLDKTKPINITGDENGTSSFLSSVTKYIEKHSPEGVKTTVTAAEETVKQQKADLKSKLHQLRKDIKHQIKENPTSKRLPEAKTELHEIKKALHKLDLTSSTDAKAQLSKLEERMKKAEQKASKYLAVKQWDDGMSEVMSKTESETSTESSSEAFEDTMSEASYSSFESEPIHKHKSKHTSLSTQAQREALQDQFKKLKDIFKDTFGDEWYDSAKSEFKHADLEGAKSSLSRYTRQAAYWMQDDFVDGEYEQLKQYINAGKLDHAASLMTGVKKRVQELAEIEKLEDRLEELKETFDAVVSDAPHHLSKKAPGWFSATSEADRQAIERIKEDFARVEKHLEKAAPTEGKVSAERSTKKHDPKHALQLEEKQHHRMSAKDLLDEIEAKISTKQRDPAVTWGDSLNGWGNWLPIGRWTEPDGHFWARTTAQKKQYAEKIQKEAEEQEKRLEAEAKKLKALSRLKNSKQAASLI